MEIKLKLLPPLKLIYVRCIEPSPYWAVTHFLQFALNKRDHLPRVAEITHEFTILVAVAAVFHVPAAIRISAALARILFHWHAAALAEFVKFSHDLKI